MRTLSGCLLASCALIASTASSFAFEAMLANDFALYPHPYSHERVMTLGAGDYVNIDRCDHGWCAVTHGPHSGYIRSNHMIDGEEYAAAHGGGYDWGNPVGAAAGLVAAPVEAGVSFLRWMQHAPLVRAAHLWGREGRLSRLTPYYNDCDPFAVHVLHVLMAKNIIAPGDVDARSIKEVKPDELKG